MSSSAPSTAPEPPAQSGPVAVGSAAASAAEQAALQAAMAELSAGRLDAAEALLEPWRDGAELVDTYTVLAHAAGARGKLEAALAHLLLAEARFPVEPRVWKALAAMYRVLRRPVEELAYRRKLVYLVADPGTRAYSQFAWAYAEVHRHQADAAWGEIKFVARKIAARPVEDAADLVDRLALAQSLYEIKAMADEAYAHYFSASPCPPGYRDVSVGWARLDHWCERAGAPLVRSAELGRVGHRPMLAELSRVAVLPGLQWAPVLDESNTAVDGFMMHRLKFRATTPGSNLLMHRQDRRAELRLPAELALRPGPALLLGGMPQYYHQTVEFLGTLAVAESLGAASDLPLVVNDDLAPFQLEQFALLGIAAERLLRVKAEAPVRFERLWVATRPVQGGRWIDPLVPAWYRARLALPDAAGTRRLYLSRGTTTRRRLVNEAEVMAMLARRGYESVQPEHLSVREQVALFSQASHIVAPTGAALTNMIFAPPGAQVTAIYNQAVAEVDGDLYFSALAQACGHRFSRVDAPGVALDGSERSTDADIRVDLTALEQALDQAAG